MEGRLPTRKILAANSENLLQLTRRVAAAHPGLRLCVHVGVGRAAAAQRRRA